MAIRRLAGCLVFIAFGFLSHFILAGDAGMDSGYLVQSWQTSEGLPQNSVTTIRQTRDGYLWLGTFNGLVRFDGIHATVFTSVNSPGLASDSINVLYEDRNGWLWIGTDGGGLVRYRNGVFTSLQTTNRFGSSVIRTIAEEESGDILAGTDGGLFRWKNGQFAEILSSGKNTESIPMISMVRDGKGNVWCSTKRGLFVCKAGKLEKLESAEANIQELMSGNDGSVLHVGMNLLLSRADGAAGSLMTLPAGRRPNCLLQTRNGDYWFGDSHGLIHCRNGLQRDYTIADGLSSNDIITLFEDNEGNIWAGSNGGGLMRLREKTLQTISTKNGLPSDDVVAILEASPGRMWIGGFNMGIGVWENSRYQNLEGLPDGMRDVYSLCRGQGGRIWMGSRSGHLVCWENDRIIGSEFFGSEGARVIFEDKQGGLWLGTRNQGLVHRLGGETNRYAPGGKLSHGYVTSIVQDREGAIWAGTKKGLNRIHKGEVTQYFRAQGLGSDCIHTLYIDREGVLWAGTVGGGIARFRDGLFSAVGARQGLPNEVVAQIIEDGSGYIWIGSNNGICRVSRNELLDCSQGRVALIHPLTYNRADGMLNPECAGSFQPSCIQSRDGRLWFATVGGVAVVDPARLASNSLAPLVKIESVTGDNFVCDAAFNASADPVAKVPPGASRVQIAFTGLYFAAPDKIRFRFKMEGWDHDWVDAEKRRSAYYSHLLPGRYRFHVTACNNDGVWNRTGSSIEIVIQPFWWQTLWFKMAFALALAALIGGGIYVEYSRRLRRNLELADQRNARLRAEELSETNEKLQARTSELEQALANVKTLSGLVPICSGCKKIRDDSGYWNSLETYLREHSHAEFSHGLCPDCIPKYFPGIKLPGQKQV